MAQLFFLVLIICVPIAVAVLRTSPYESGPTLGIRIDPFEPKWTPTRRLSTTLEHKRWVARYQEELRRAGGPQGE